MPELEIVRFGQLLYVLRDLFRLSCASSLRPHADTPIRSVAKRQSGTLRSHAPPRRPTEYIGFFRGFTYFSLFTFGVRRLAGAVRTSVPGVPHLSPLASHPGRELCGFVFC